MLNGLFEPEELVTRHDASRPIPGWTLSSTLEEDAPRLMQRVMERMSGLTLVIDDQPEGSGVFVSTTKAYGVLTAGHVCERIADAIDRGSELRWLLQGAYTPSHNHPLLARKLEVRGAVLAYDRKRNAPDFGCLKIPQLDGRDMVAWATPVNITPQGPSRKSPEYRLECNAWVAAGFLAERSQGRTVTCLHGIGGPEAVYERDGLRYFYIKTVTPDVRNPRALNGMSGCGVWELPTASLPDDVSQIGDPVLRGISFWQDPPEASGELAFYAHELESIADDVVASLDEGQ